MGHIEIKTFIYFRLFLLFLPVRHLSLCPAARSLSLSPTSRRTPPASTAITPAVRPPPLAPLALRASPARTRTRFPISRSFCPRGRARASSLYRRFFPSFLLFWHLVQRHCSATYALSVSCSPSPRPFLLLHAYFTRARCSCLRARSSRRGMACCFLLVLIVVWFFLRVFCV